MDIEKIKIYTAYYENDFGNEFGAFLSDDPILARNVDCQVVTEDVFNLIKSAYIELQDRLTAAESRDYKNLTCMGVGSGDGNLFVYGDYDSIKAAQNIVIERDQLRAKLSELDAEQDVQCENCDGEGFFEGNGACLICFGSGIHPPLSELENAAKGQEPDYYDYEFELYHKSSDALNDHIREHGLKLYEHPPIPEQTTPAESVQHKVIVTDPMIYGFHNAITDGPIGSDDFEEIKKGLLAALSHLDADYSPKVEQVSGSDEPVYFHQKDSEGKLWEECTKEEMMRYGTIFQRTLYLHPSPNNADVPSLAEQLEFVKAERDGYLKHRDQLLMSSPHWVEIDNPEDAPTDGNLVLWDGCDLSVDYVENEVDYGTSFFANGTEATHYLAGLTTPLPPLKDE